MRFFHVSKLCGDGHFKSFNNMCMFNNIIVFEDGSGY